MEIQNNTVIFLFFSKLKTNDFNQRFKHIRRFVSVTGGGVAGRRGGGAGTHSYQQ